MVICRDGLRTRNEPWRPNAEGDCDGEAANATCDEFRAGFHVDAPMSDLARRTRAIRTRSADDALLYGPQRGGSSRRHADLVVDVLDVVIGGFGRDEQPIADLARGEPLGRELQHVDFATGQP